MRLPDHPHFHILEQDPTISETLSFSGRVLRANLLVFHLSVLSGKVLRAVCTVMDGAFIASSGMPVGVPLALVRFPAGANVTVLFPVHGTDVKSCSINPNK